MDIKRYSVKKLNKMSRKYVICCMGCGKRLNDMLDNYQNEEFVSKIEYLIDNNSNLWGIEKTVGSKVIKISGKEVFDQEKNKKILLIITSDRSIEIYKSIECFVKKKETVCVVYPKYYYTYTEQLMRICAKLPLQKRLLFYAEPHPHDNADAIVKYLNTEYQGEKFQIIYLANTEEKREGVRYINKKDLEGKAKLRKVMEFCYYFATSRYMFYENEALQKVREKQKLIYLNHGAVPLKQVSDVLKQSEELDYAICPSTGCARFYEEQYGIPVKKQLYMMHARMNVLFNPEKDIQWIAGEKKYILWLPTFRQLSGSDRKDSNLVNPLSIVNSEKQWRELDQCLQKNNQCLVIKKHPREKTILNIPNSCINIKLLVEQEIKNQGTSLHEILSHAEALLTDYSGIAFEYMLLNRPIGYVVTDMEDYTRGFSVDNPLDYMPGPKILTFNQFIQFIHDVNEGKDPFEKQRQDIAKELFCENAYENGAEKLIAYINQERV